MSYCIPAKISTLPNTDILFQQNSYMLIPMLITHRGPSDPIIDIEVRNPATIQTNSVLTRRTSILSISTVNISNIYIL